MSTYDNNPYGPPGGGGGGPSHKAQFLHLLHSIRTVARGKLFVCSMYLTPRTHILFIPYSSLDIHQHFCNWFQTTFGLI